MPGYVLTANQLRTVVDLAGLPEPAPGSPLYPMPPGEVLHPDDPEFTLLFDVHVLEENGDGKARLNMLFGAALRTAVEPEEVISVGIDDHSQPGISIARRETFLTEASMSRSGSTKFYFPLSRNQLLLLLGDALTTERPEPEPLGFRFVGAAEDAFVFAAAMRELREYPAGLTPERLREVVQEAALVPAFAGPFTMTVGVDPIERLAASREAVDAAVGRLLLAGHLERSGTLLRSSEAADALLGEHPRASFAVARTVVGPDGPRKRSVSVTRVGDRNLVFRIRYPEGEAPRFEWVEMNRDQLRVLVAGMVMTDEQLELALNPPEVPEEPAAPAAAAAEEGPQIRFCPYCAAGVEPGYRFCGSCGRSLPEV